MSDPTTDIAERGISARDMGLPSYRDLRRAELEEQGRTPEEAAQDARAHRRSRLSPAARLLSMNEP